MDLEDRLKKEHELIPDAGSYADIRRLAGNLDTGLIIEAVTKYREIASQEISDLPMLSQADGIYRSLLPVLREADESMDAIISRISSKNYLIATRELSGSVKGCLESSDEVAGKFRDAALAFFRKGFTEGLKHGRRGDIVKGKEADGKVHSAAGIYLGLGGEDPGVVRFNDDAWRRAALDKEREEFLKYYRDGDWEKKELLEHKRFRNRMLSRPDFYRDSKDSASILNMAYATALGDELDRLTDKDVSALRSLDNIISGKSDAKEIDTSSGKMRLPILFSGRAEEYEAFMDRGRDAAKLIESYGRAVQNFSGLVVDRKIAMYEKHAAALRTLNDRYHSIAGKDIESHRMSMEFVRKGYREAKGLKEQKRRLLLEREKILHCGIDELVNYTPINLTVVHPYIEKAAISRNKAVEARNRQKIEFDCQMDKMHRETKNTCGPGQRARGLPSLSEFLLYNGFPENSYLHPIKNHLDGEWSRDYPGRYRGLTKALKTVPIPDDYIDYLWVKNCLLVADNALEKGYIQSLMRKHPEIASEFRIISRDYLGRCEKRFDLAA